MLSGLAALGKIGAGVVAFGALVGSCTAAADRGAENIHDVNPRNCAHTVDGTTGTTTLEDGTVFGITIMPDGSRALTRELGKCN